MESVYLWLLDSDHPQSFEVVCSLCDVSQIFFFQTLRKFEQIFEQTKWKETIETSKEAIHFENKRKNLQYKISARKKHGKCGNLSVKKVARVCIVKSKRFADENNKFIEYVFYMILKGATLKEAREKKEIEWKIEIVVDSQYFFVHSLDYVNSSINMKMKAILS